MGMMGLIWDGKGGGLLTNPNSLDEIVNALEGRLG